jgi:phosphoribosylanthranilate isomerase
VPLVKICGITNIADALAAAEAGADALGFVCDENSPRYVDPETFATIHYELPKSIQRIGVFDKTTGFEWRTMGFALMNAFDQLQYYQDSVWTDIIRENWDMRKKIKAFWVQNINDMRSVARYNGLAQSYLVNAHPSSKAFTGSDAEAWRLARQAHQFGKRLYLAGGLTPKNVADAIATVYPYAVDVTVGVEKAPGVKDRAKMRDFIQAARR